MSGSDRSGATRSGLDEGRRRRLLLVALCILGALLAAFAVPPVTGGQADGGPTTPGSTTAEPTTSSDARPGEDGGGSTRATQTDGGNGAGGDDSGDGSGGGGAGGGGAGGAANGSGGTGGGGGDASGGGGAAGGRNGTGVVGPGTLEEGDLPADGCIVVLVGERVPGKLVTVHVRVDAEPVADVGVEFNDRFVGRTGPDGRVIGRVPYREELRVDVAVPSEPSCRFATASALVSGSAAGSVEPAADPAGPAIATTRFASLGLPAVRFRPALAAGALPGDEPGLRQTDDGDHTGRYPVRGDVEIAVHGEPYPGETVTLVATVEDVAMPDAAVAVDGERVGRTGAGGSYSLRLPDDGRDRVVVTVSRGDFAGERAIRIERLTVGVAPSSPLPLPGGWATVRATIDGESVPGAVVWVDGRRVGTTGGDGEAGIRLPSDPGATVAVRALGQTATTALWWVYAPTIVAGVLVALLFAASLVVGYRRRGLRGLGRVAAAWLAVAVVVVPALVLGPDAGLLALGLLALGGVVAVLATRRTAVADGARDAASTLDALLQWLLGQALRVTGLLIAAAQRGRAVLGRLRAWAATLPRSVSGLLARAGDWVRTAPGRLRTALVRRYDRRAAVAVAVAVLVVAGATALRGTTGFLVSVGLLAAAGVAVLARRRQGTGESTTGDDGSSDQPRPTRDATATADTDESPSQPSLRERWRTFARWVAATDWRRRTPGEVSRLAVDRGFPPEPVARLTHLFREVEYGDRPPSRDRRERATEAFEALEAARRRDRGSGES